jgi:C4-dicarboxylate transporter/malic acid transport protein
MLSPGQDGFRTPTGEDFAEFNKDPHTPNTPRGGRNYDDDTSTPILSGARSHFSMSLSEQLDKLDEKLQWRQRIRHFTWTFFTSTMATGGLANVLYNVPFRFKGLDTIGTVFFLFNLVLFVVNCTCMFLRFALFPTTFRLSFLHPTESLFVPAAVVSFGTVLINVSQYGLGNVGYWLNTTVLVLFWCDAALAVITSCGIYLLMWSTQTFTIAQMTPVWIFPAYPLLIIGPHAAVLAETLLPDRGLKIIIGGWTLQGVGYMVSLMIYAAFIYRLMTQKLPQEGLRPGMFVSVGPSGFTSASVVGMAAAAERVIPADFMGNGPMTALILKVVANWMALWLWALALWFFFVSVGAHWSCARTGHGIPFSMTWFSYVFPNTALITATFAIGKVFDSVHIQILGCVMTCLLIVVWMAVFGLMIRAISTKQILWPSRQEDRDEGGFKASEFRTDGTGGMFKRRAARPSV